MRRPEVLFFDSNETMLDMGAMKPQVVEVLGGRDLIDIADQLEAMPV